MNANKLATATKVQDIFGEWHIVNEIIDNMIYTLDQKVIHITKVINFK
jgi:hypothetical protein